MACAYTCLRASRPVFCLDAYPALARPVLVCPGHLFPFIFRRHLFSCPFAGLALWTLFPVFQLARPVLSLFQPRLALASLSCWSAPDIFRPCFEVRHIYPTIVHFLTPSSFARICPVIESSMLLSIFPLFPYLFASLPSLFAYSFLPVRLSLPSPVCLFCSRAKEKTASFLAACFRDTVCRLLCSYNLFSPYSFVNRG